ncbi:MAG TPA: hypothetical protein VKT28_08815 [Puia sp.]|nr:hypothetical protein [Puia sp.]
MSISIFKNYNLKMFKGFKQNRLIFFFLSMGAFFNGCEGQIQQCQKKMTSDSVNKEVPVSKSGKPYSYYQNKSKVESALGLKTLENGFDSLQIRIWYSYAFSDSFQLVIIKRTENEWMCNLLSGKYNFETESNQIKSIEKTIHSKTPISGWNNFVVKLIKLNITTLPDENRISNYPEFADGDNIVVEISTKNNYRIYSYTEPEKTQNEIQEAKNLEAILFLIEREFDFKPLRGI